MSRLALFLAAALSACLILAATAHADENETATATPETPVVEETAVAPPPVETATAPADETPEPATPPVEETPEPVTPPARTPAPPPSTGGAARYEVTVGFNTSVTQDDYDEVSAVLRAYDDELEYVIMESWPPIGRALLTTDVADFCQTVEAELEAKSYIDHVSCGPVEPGPPPTPAPDGDEVIAPAPVEPAPGTPEAVIIIAPPPTGAGSASGGSWSWWPLAVAGAAAGAAGVLLVYQGRRAKA